LQDTIILQATDILYPRLGCTLA